LSINIQKFPGGASKIIVVQLLFSLFEPARIVAGFENVAFDGPHDPIKPSSFLHHRIPATHSASSGCRDDQGGLFINSGDK